MKLIHTLRRLPLWGLTSIGMLGLTLVLVLARGLFGPASTTHVALTQAAPAAPTAQNPESQPAPATTTPLAPLSSGAAPTAEPAVAGSVLADALTAELRVPTSALQPPDGVQEGYVVRVDQARDQYDQWVTTGTSVATIPDASFFVPREQQGRQQRFVWQAWFQLDATASVALLQAKGDQGTVAASIDGKPIGEIEHYTNRPPTRQIASIQLAPGWHQLTVTQSGSAIAQVAVTDGQHAPVILVPWAVTAVGAAVDEKRTTADPASAGSSASAPSTSSATESPARAGEAA